MINVTLGEAKPQEKPFPKLMISCDGREPEWIIEVHKKDEKVIAIHRAGLYKGDIATEFELNNEFTDYNEPITLQNA